MIKGIIYIVAASVAYGLMPVFSSRLLDMGMNTQSILMFRIGFSAIGALAILLFTKTPIKVKRNQFLQLMFFGLVGYGGTAFLLTTAYGLIPTGMATMFHFSYPLLVTLIMALLFKERLTGGKILAVLSALAGIILISDFSSGVLNVKGVAVALCSGLTYAVYIISNRKGSFRDLPPMVIVFYVTSALTVLFSLEAIATGTVVVPPSPRAWIYCMAVGWIVSLLALCLLNMAVRTIGATYTAIGNMLEPITSLIAGAVVYGDAITGRSAAGCAFILLAVFLVGIDGSGLFRRGKIR